MKKKILSICLVAVIAVMAIAGASLAYLTDNDAKTNTFTIGNVDIHIDEYMKDKDGNWIDYTDAQKLSPIAQSDAPFNKMVVTVNDGTEDAYIRTFITCPVDLWNVLGYGFNSGSNAQDIIKDDETTIHYLDKWSYVGPTTVNGEEVYIFVCEHEEKIPAGDSILSLTKVWVYDNVDNEDISKAQLVSDTASGRGMFGIEVYSEAIQAENLTYDEAMKALQGDATLLDHAASLFNNN